MFREIIKFKFVGKKTSRCYPRMGQKFADGQCPRGVNGLNVASVAEVEGEMKS
jgi:hypothetical protein